MVVRPAPLPFPAIVLAALTTFVVIGSACSASRDVGLSLSVPAGVSETTAWFEVGAFKDARCSAIEPMLGNGLPEGAVARLAFQPKEGAPASFGEIPTASYAFAAVARAGDCGVLARGCVDADVDDIDTVSISLAPTEEPTGRCPPGASCLAGKCTSANRNDDPSVGANCSLELVGAGPLTTPAGVGEVLSAPAIAATPQGFFIAYREVHPIGGANVTILPVDFGGGAKAPLRPRLQNPCLDADETDGVGLVFDGDDGILALAKAPCGTPPELQLLNFDTDLSLGKLLVSPPATGKKVTLGASRSAVVRRQGNVVVYTEEGQGKIANLDKGRGIVGPDGSFGGTTDVTDTWVAASDSVLALLAAKSGNLALLMVDGDTPITQFDAANGSPRPPVEFPGEWASIAAAGGRVIVLSDGDGPGRSVTYRTFDLGRDEPNETNGFSIEGQDKVTAGDVAIVGDRAYFAVLKPGAVALHVYDNVTTRPRPLNDVSFARESRISGVNTVKDGRVAVAATESRVAVVWTTARILSRNDTTGFYAVFACTP